MIDYYAVYTPYTMLFIASTVICLSFGAFLCAYGVANVGKGLLYWTATITLLGVLSTLVTGLMALVSPSWELQDFYLTLQRFIGLLTIIPILLVLFGMLKIGCGGRHFGAYGAVFLIHIVCVLNLWHNAADKWVDYLLVLDFTVFSIFLLFSRHSLFLELSPISIDNFMQELDDIIIIFDRNEEFIDANRQAKEWCPYLKNGLPLSEFLENISAITISNEKIEIKNLALHEEINLSLTTGNRYYQINTTWVKNKKGIIQATVLVFHDITVKSLLEKELEDKNSELEELNIKLKAYLDKAEKLVEEEQKAKAAREVEETIGVQIAQLLEELESMNADDDQEKLSGMIDNCREVMAGIRLAVHKLMQDSGKDVEDDQISYSR